VRTILEDLLAERRGGGADQGGVTQDAVDRPGGVSAMARRHVLGHRGVPAITGPPEMGGGALALEEDLDSAGREARLDLGPSEPVGHAVEVIVELDMIVDAGAA
jgi:hypothetical protein